MKIVIDIPDYDYRQIKEYYEKNDIVEATYSYIYHGIQLDEILDKIRAEIVEMRSKQNVGVLECLDIIDKYRGEVDCRDCKVEHDCYECEKYAESEES